MALNSLSELPLVGPLSGAKQTPLWQPPETGFDHERTWADLQDPFSHHRVLSVMTGNVSALVGIVVSRPAVLLIGAEVASATKLACASPDLLAVPMNMRPATAIPYLTRLVLPCSRLAEPIDIGDTNGGKNERNVDHDLPHHPGLGIACPI